MAMNPISKKPLSNADNRVLATWSAKPEPPFYPEVVLPPRGAVKPFSKEEANAKIILEGPKKPLRQIQETNVIVPKFSLGNARKSRKARKGRKSKSRKYKK